MRDLFSDFLGKNRTDLGWAYLLQRNSAFLKISLLSYFNSEHWQLMYDQSFRLQFGSTILAPRIINLNLFVCLVGAYFCELIALEKKLASICQ